jgi:hypothetical protein
VSKSIFDEILDLSTPPEQFDVPLPSGHILVFSGVGSIDDLERLRSEASKWAEAVKDKMVAPDLVQFATLKPATLRRCFMLDSMMDGVRRSHDEAEVLPKWTRMEWLIYATRAASVFENIAEDVDAYQLGLANKVEQAEVEELKNDSCATLSVVNA